MEPSDSTEPGTPALVRRLNRHLTDEQRQDLIRWSEELLAIRESDVPPLEKARRALEETYRARVVLAFLSGAGGTLRQVAWDDRSWAARLGLGGAAFAVAAFGGQGAGLAAVGTAIAVPLWIVLGAGGSFAGMLIDELQAALARRSGPPALAGEEIIQDGEWEFLDEPSQPASLPVSTTGSEESRQESLWTVFRRAYNDARARQEAAEHEPPEGGAP